MRVLAKFFVAAAKRYSWGDRMEFTLQAVTSKQGDNAQWSKASPSGELKITVDNKEAWPFFIEAMTDGRYVILTLEHGELGAPAAS